ncbi:MAG: alpha/beta hydrolase [Pseudomonadota bacterium]|nr:alpha/beta hydrolase [Pseudomonadota bacterium]
MNTKPETDLSYWNSQFQFTRLLPDFADHVARMGERSAGVTLPFERITHGDDPRQFVEVTGTPAPGAVLPVFIHGGYWRALEAERHRFLIPTLTGIAGAAANLEYRLLPHVTLGDIIADALAGLTALIERYDVRLLVVGHSAGGHLAVTAAQALGDRVVGAVGISGLYDLTPLQWSFLREEVGLKAADLVGHSPQEMWAGQDARHVVVAVGGNETAEFHRQAQMFASSYGARFLAVEGTHHMNVLDALADPEGILARTVAQIYRDAG